MQINEAGLGIIRIYEGLRLKAIMKAQKINSHAGTKPEVKASSHRCAA